MLFYPSSIDLPSRTLRYPAEQLRARQQEIGTHGVSAESGDKPGVGVAASESSSRAWRPAGRRRHHPPCRDPPMTGPPHGSTGSTTRSRRRRSAGRTRPTDEQGLPGRRPRCSCTVPRRPARLPLCDMDSARQAVSEFRDVAGGRIDTAGSAETPRIRCRCRCPTSG